MSLSRPFVLCLALGVLLGVPAAQAHSGDRPLASGGAVYTIDGDKTAIARLTADFDIWSFSPRRSQAVAYLNPTQADALRARGYAVELDGARTQRLQAVRAAMEEGAGAAGTIPGFPCYRTVSQTYADLAALAAAHPGLATFTDIGDGWEKATAGTGSDIMALKLTNAAIAGSKPQFVLIAAIHARELVTAELATRFAEELVAGYGVDPDVTWLLDTVEVHIVPQLNPDGRRRAEAGSSWRKNTDNDFCANTSSRGIDLNRNSSFLWGGGGSSGSACSETYRGPSEASEPETQAIEAYLAAILPDQKGPNLTDPAPATAEGVFISLHSFGELVLFPWEATFTNGPNHAQLQTLGRKFGFFNQHEVCQDCLPSASGTTVDVAYGEYGVAAYTFELGGDFFESCASFESTILPTNLPALRYALKAARRPYQEPLGPDALSVALSAAVTAGEPLTLSARLDDRRYDSNGQGNEATQNIAAAFYTLDAPPFTAGAIPQPMAPVDGSFNAGFEDVTVQLTTAGLGAGRHRLFVFGEDALGNRGVPTAIDFERLDAGLLFLDGFESGDPGAWSASVP
jgi:carboxypeptidase T